ncbi:MAG TPA: DUF4878 domain-containing protein [Ignavibacteria bacterium]|nr:DUF4878 domain-containing protein [Ignavibacteria bacterium]HQY51087.1 DUF4878 domain-containing protein [Ignavibacteria bacterium]HRB00474.1 DUF4878 domain-containing protein [Ignavibacteria bacterium]
MRKYIYSVVIILLLIVSGCGSTGGSDSPANSLKDFVAALKEQNPGKAWNFLSSNSQKMYDDIAKNRNQSGKEYFEKSVSNVSSLGLIGMDFEVIDEKKDGDNAVIIIKSKDSTTSEYFSVKESGVWKLDYAKTIEENMKKVE